MNAYHHADPAMSSCPHHLTVPSLQILLKSQRDQGLHVDAVHHCEGALGAPN